MSALKIKNQKIIKVGNSFAVTLDRKFLDRTGLQDGSDVIAKYDEDTASVTFATPNTYAASQNRPLLVAEQKAVYATKVNSELKDWTDKFLQQNAESLEELANL